MLLYETLQEIQALQDYKKPLRTIIKINNCDSQSQIGKDSP